MKTLSFKTVIMLTLLILTLSVNMYAQKPDIEFEHISIEDGLSQTGVVGILQDSKGFMWFATQDGLNQCDGNLFTIYKHIQNDPNSLIHNRINSICEDSQGHIWVATYGGGLSRYDRATKRFIHYQNDPQNPNSLSHNGVYCIIEDHLGMFWIGTENGLNRYERVKKQFTHYKHDPDNPKSLSDNRVHSILEDRSGVLWVGHGQAVSIDTIVPKRNLLIKKMTRLTQIA